MATYASVMDVLARLYGSGQSTSGPLKGRLQNLARMGIPLGPRPGKGVALDYGDSETFQLAFACELEDAGLPPGQVGYIIATWWQKDIFEYFKREISAPDAHHDHLFFICLGQIELVVSGKPPADCLQMFHGDTSAEKMAATFKDLDAMGWRHTVVVNISRLTRDVQRLRAQPGHVASHVADNRRGQVTTVENQMELAETNAT